MGEIQSPLRRVRPRLRITAQVSAATVAVVLALAGLMVWRSSMPASTGIPARSSSGGSTSWVREFGNSKVWATGVAVDRAGNVVVVGYTFEALSGQVSAGYIDAFVRVYAPDGTERWTREFGTADADKAAGVAVDGAGDVVVAGTTNGTFPGQPAAAGHGASTFVRVYAPDGTERWTRQFETDTYEPVGVAVATDSTGEVVLAGETHIPLASSGIASAIDAFVRVYGPEGTERWTRDFGVVGAWADRVAVDGSGNVIVAGQTAGALPGQAEFYSQIDTFVRSYGPDGSERWTRQFGFGSYSEADGVATDSSGNVFVVAEADPTSQFSATSSSYVVRSYSPDGTERWTTWNAGHQEKPNGIAADATGNTVVVSDDSIGPSPMKGSYLRAYSPDGTERWARQVPGVVALSVVVDPSDTAVLAGYSTVVLPGQEPGGDPNAVVLSTGLNLPSTGPSPVPSS